MNNSVVLHIEDMADFRLDVKGVLAPQGFDILSMASSQEAMRLEPGRDFEVALLDNAGFEYGGHLRAQQLTVPIIVLSGAPEDAAFNPDVSIRKGESNWSTQLLRALNSRHDVFDGLSDEMREFYRGKVLVISGRPERVVIVAENVEQARDELADSQYSERYARFVQGPPSEPMTLSTLEGR